MAAFQNTHASSSQPHLQFDEPIHLFYDDGLGQSGCAGDDLCRARTRSFRELVSRARRVGTRFLPCTLSEFLCIPEERIRQGLYSVAMIDLDVYPDASAFLDAARTLTKKRGRVNRELGRAAGQGYVVRRFARAEYAADMVDIHASKAIRDRRPMEGAFYKKNAAEIFAGTKENNDCPQHYHEYWGVFLPGTENASHEKPQAKLVGYIGLERRGSCAWYNVIMGHGAHLRNGIMYLLHYELVRTLLNRRPAGLRYLAYYTFVRRPNDEAARWKYLALFKPCYLHYVEDRRIIFLANGEPAAGEALMALKETMAIPWPEAVSMGNKMGISQEWLFLLHRAWIVSTARTPGLVQRFLRSAKTPSLDVLRPLAPDIFPREALKDMEHVTVILHGASRGLDTLLPLHDAGSHAVSVFHSNSDELLALQRTYPSRWAYAQIGSGIIPRQIEKTISGLLILELPASLGKRGYLGIASFDAIARAFAKRLLISADHMLFELLKCDRHAPLEVIGRAFTDLFGHAVVCNGIFFRHGHPEEEFWVWLERT